MEFTHTYETTSDPFTISSNQQKLHLTNTTNHDSTESPNNFTDDQSPHNSKDT